MGTASENFGARIKEIRTLRGISQEKLALKANVNVSFLGQVERGNKKPTIDTVDKLLNALDISYRDFFDIENNNFKNINFEIIDKITYELKTRTIAEQQLVYDIMRRILVHNDFSDTQK